MSDIGLDVGQANELKLAFRRHDWSNSDIKKLCEGHLLADVLRVMRGDSQVVSVERKVDLTTFPVGVATDQSQVVRHLKHGKKKWSDLRPIVMDPYDLHYVSGRYGLGSHEVRLDQKTLRPRFLKGQRPANICLRDYLLKNPHLMPECENSKPLLFWGTVCVEQDGFMWVPGIQYSWGKLSEYNRMVLHPSKYAFEEYDNPCLVLV